jgi:hypothetical protein
MYVVASGLKIYAYLEPTDMRGSSYQEGLELAGVQMTPKPLLPMVIAGQLPLTLRATKLRLWWVGNPYANLSRVE